MEITIFRLDYKNTNERGFPVLKNLHSIDEISDLNEVRTISFTFESKNEAEKFVLNFPKSYRPYLSTLCGIDDGKGGYISKPYASISFNTFFHNKTTGEKNETAISKREKFIKKLKELI